MIERPSPAVGLRLALRLRKLVGAVWFVSVAVFLPVQLIILGATGGTRANLPAGDLPPGEDLLLLIELIRPVAIPLAISLALGVALFAAWTVLWHGGTVRWWLGAGAARVRLAEIIGHGVVWWWRYFRLALTAALIAAAAFGAIWIPTRMLSRMVGSRGEFLLLATGVLLTATAFVLVWLTTVRGCWLLGESGRRSAVVAWFRGLVAVARQPLRSLAPVVVWGIPGTVLLVVPVLIDVPFATMAILLGWLAAAFCWVALHLSYAPPQPIPKPEVSPLDPPGTFATTRFPTLHDNR
jgi:hypothetical protein